jgi:hypothetical protein
MPFAKARKIVSKLGIKTELEYKRWARNGMLPKGIPTYPYFVYHVRRKEGWSGWKDFLGQPPVFRLTAKEKKRRAARAAVRKKSLLTPEKIRLREEVLNMTLSPAYLQSVRNRRNRRS